MAGPRPDAPHTPAGGAHETRDVRFRPVVLAGAGLVVLTALAFVAMLVLLRYYAAREARLSPPASPLAAVYGRQAPPEPRLQAAPIEDLHALRAAEEAQLTSYGWVDREAGIVRIPIERALDLAAARGLPMPAEPHEEAGR